MFASESFFNDTLLTNYGFPLEKSRPILKARRIKRNGGGIKQLGLSRVVR